VFSAPQLSVLELRCIAELLGGRRVHPNTALVVTTNFQNREIGARLGYVQAIEAAGGQVFAGIPVMHRLSPDPLTALRTGDRVRMSPGRGVVELVA
jgi:predicted aconitase